MEHMVDQKEHRFDFRTLMEKTLGKKWIFWAGIAAAVLLLVLSFWSENEPAAEPTAVQTLSVEATEQALEERLVQLLSQVEGAGQVSVMVTLENTAQTVYAQAVQQTSNTATNAQGSSVRSDYATDYVIVGDSGGKQALEETTLQPTIKGVAIVCSGAEDIQVVSRITQLVSTVLGVSSNRICVTK